VFRYFLGISPVIYDRNLLDATNCAGWSTGLSGQIFTPHVLFRVVLQRYGGVAALLRAIMNEAILANVEITRARAASPVIRITTRKILLEPVQSRVSTLAVVLDLAVDPLFEAIQRLHRAIAVVDDSQRTLKSKLNSTMGDLFGILGISNTSAYDRIDVDDKLGKFLQVFELFVEDFQALDRHVVRLDVIDAYLKVIQAGLIQRDDLFGREQISVRDHPGNHAVMAYPLNDALYFGVEQGLTTTNCNDGGSQTCEEVDAPQHGIYRNRRRKIVILVAISTSEIAAAGGDNMGKQYMIGGRQSAKNHLPFAPPELQLLTALHRTSRFEKSGPTKICKIAQNGTQNETTGDS